MTDSSPFLTEAELAAKVARYRQKRRRYPPRWFRLRMLDAMMQLFPAAVPRTKTVVFSYGGLGELVVTAHWIAQLRACFRIDNAEDVHVVWFTEQHCSEDHRALLPEGTGISVINPRKIARAMRYRARSLRALRRLGAKRILFPQSARNPMIYDTLAFASGAEFIWMYPPAVEPGEGHPGRTLAFLLGKYTAHAQKALLSACHLVEPLPAVHEPGVAHAVQRHALARFAHLSAEAAKLERGDTADFAPGIILQALAAPALDPLLGELNGRSFGLLNVSTNSVQRSISGEYYAHVLQHFATTSEMVVVAFRQDQKKIASVITELFAALGQACPENIWQADSGGERWIALGERARLLIADADVRRMRALCGHAAWVVSPDTAIAHIALASHTPTLVVISDTPDTDINYPGYMFPYPAEIQQQSTTVRVPKSAMKTPSAGDCAQVTAALAALVETSTYISPSPTI